MKYGKKILSCLLVGTTLLGMTALFTGTASAASKPEKVKNLNLTEKNSRKVLLKWSKVTNASGYCVTYSGNKSFKKANKIHLKGNNKVKYTTPKITGEFYAKVRAYKTIKGKKIYGDFSNTVATYVINKKDFGDENNQKIKLWVPGDQVSLVKKQCSDFSKKFSSFNIKITVKSKDEGTASAMLMNDPSSSADVAAVPCDQIESLVKEKAIIRTADAMTRTIKVSDTKAANTAFSYDNQLYAYPSRMNGYYLVYDKSVVSSTQAKSLEGILKACKNKNKKFVMDAENGYYACTFAFTGGVKLNGLTKNGRQKFTNYNENTAVATLKAFSKLMHKYSGTFASLYADNVTSGFAKGTVGAGIDGCWNATSHKEYLGKNYRTAKLPTITVNGKKRQMISLMGYVGMVVNTRSHYPRTAQALAYYLTSKQSQKDMAKSLDLAPTKKEVINSSIVKNNKGMSALSAQAKYSIPQSNMSDTFWFPMGTLGYELYNCDNPDTYNYKKLLNNTISNIVG